MQICDTTNDGMPSSIPLIFLAFTISLHVSFSREIPLTNKDANSYTESNHEYDNSLVEINPSKVIELSRHPRVFMYKGFLSDEESEHLISQAHNKLSKSFEDIDGTVNNSSSSSVFLVRGQDKIISKIEERISAWTFLPIDYGENMQISRYMPNDSRVPHQNDDVNGNNIVATILIHLSNVTRGGEIIFPKSKSNIKPKKDDTLSECGSTGFAIQPFKGDAILVFNLHPNTTSDKNSLIDTCEVLEGEKWVATKRVHKYPYPNVQKPVVDSEECTDEDENCIHWAATGECTKNPVFMLGTPDYYGSCRKSCGAC